MFRSACHPRRRLPRSVRSLHWRELGPSLYSLHLLMLWRTNFLLLPIHRGGSPILVGGNVLWLYSNGLKPVRVLLFATAGQENPRYILVGWSEWKQHRRVRGISGYVIAQARTAADLHADLIWVVRLCGIGLISTFFVESPSGTGLARKTRPLGRRWTRGYPSECHLPFVMSRNIRLSAEKLPPRCFRTEDLRGIVGVPSIIMPG